ncbi:CDP-alcohol phosphatidyltransferase family protein [Desulfocurvibacter africanus]|uniref:CDP-diacylglycerol--glycerol-3-phosphate 3-phosphatidyltransferase n=1 Tax=Desulfocurvibacter africanus subsp. africanus str. Walvis Bay TaxID=690850 RepID=F3Z2G2_DESAF|nr:CDP-alcohol phosphatidyltransferase family protein [Desulfocurvibacter africanus]EGJ51295.1 CDP-alcohol phosphatidyltransferase [Desulfocurvibacter africanus subsp. africanus str. Walvis Bay]
MEELNRNWTLPNLLTMVRILLTPGFIMAFLQEWFTLAWILFAVAGFTDGLDGFLARVLRQRSKLGAMLDPLADKVLLDASFITLAVKDWLPDFLAVLVVSRDALIIGGLLVLNFWGIDVKNIARPAWTSKLNTLLQISLVLFVLLEQTFGFDQNAVRLLLLAGVSGLTVLTAAQYIVRGMAMVKDEA